MSASAASSGFGTTFSYLSTDPSTYTALSEVISISGGDIEREVIEATHMASDDGYREKIGGMLNVTPYVVVLNYIEASATLLETLIGAGRETFKITYPGSSTRVFSGIPTGLSYGDASIDDKLTMTLTIEPSGKSVYTAV
jgi:hypothetical protein